MTGRAAARIAVAVAVAAGCDAGLRVEPPQPGIESVALDWSADPCADFYAFACGNWSRWHDIGADGAYASRQVQAQNDQISALLDIVVDDSRGRFGLDDPWALKIGDYFGGCWDTTERTAVFAPALAAQLGRAARADLATLPAVLAALNADGVWPFFIFWRESDPFAPTQPLATVYQAGSGLPKEYFEDPSLSRFRDAYRRHIDDMTSAVAASTGQRAALDGDAVMRVETALAAASLGDDDYLDPRDLHRVQSLGELQTATGAGFDWGAYFTATGVAAPPAAIDVRTPDYFGAVGRLLATLPAADLRSYLSWRVIEAAGDALGSDVDQAEFRFHSQVFYGTASISPGWWRCFWNTQGDLGFALSQPFVARRFDASRRQRAAAMIEAVRAVMAKTIASRDWLDEPTRAEAAAKLQQVIAKVGYPDQWPSYDDVQTTRSDYLQTTIWRRNRAWRVMLRSLNEPTDRADWNIAPSITNAVYSPTDNDITFPAAILQAPFFAPEYPAAVNYGAIGSVMGHELTHGFDDSGRLYDGLGALRDWWSAPVAAEFERRASCLVDQYDAYRAVGDLHVDGAVTLSENIADLGGLKLAYAAFHDPAGGQGAGAPGLLSPDQQFFVAFAQTWCEKDRPAYLESQVRNDAHAPARYRVNGTVTNVPEFAPAFRCEAGAPLAPRNRCEVW